MSHGVIREIIAWRTCFASVQAVIKELTPSDGAKKFYKPIKNKPWVLRRFAPENDDVGAIDKRNELLGFKNTFMLHAPPSETDASLGHGNPEIEVRDIANAFCDAVAHKFDLFLPVYKSHSYLLPTESVSLFNKRPNELRLAGCTGRTSFEALMC